MIPLVPGFGCATGSWESGLGISVFCGFSLKKIEISD